MLLLLCMTVAGLCGGGGGGMKGGRLVGARVMELSSVRSPGINIAFRINQQCQQHP